MKKFVALMLSIVLVFALVACGQKEEAPAPEAGGAPAVEENKPVTLKYSDLNAETSHTGIYAKKFKEIVEAKDVGITIDYYPNGTLTGQDIEACAAGLTDFLQCTPSTAAGIWAPMAAMDAPYIYTTKEEALKVVAPGSDWLTYVNDPANMPAAGVRMVGAFFAQSRETTTTDKPIYSLDDMKGMKFRVVNGDLYIKLFRAFGCEPTPMAFSEVPTALVTGVCEGQENPYSSLVTSKMYEMQDYVIETHHMPANYGFFMNQQAWEKLSPAQQKAVEESFYEASEWQNNWIFEDLEKNRQICIDGGMTVINEENGLDLAAFTAAAMTIYDEYADQWGDAVSIIQGCYK